MGASVSILSPSLSPAVTGQEEVEEEAFSHQEGDGPPCMYPLSLPFSFSLLSLSLLRLLSLSFLLCLFLSLLFRLVLSLPCRLTQIVYVRHYRKSALPVLEASTVLFSALQASGWSQSSQIGRRFVQSTLHEKNRRFAHKTLQVMS